MSLELLQKIWCTSVFAGGLSIILLRVIATRRDIKTVDYIITIIILLCLIMFALSTIGMIWI
jgi:hypothetical protein